MKQSYNIYLDNFTYEDAISTYAEKLSEVFQIEEIEISSKDSLGYVLTKPVFAKVSSPNFTASAMDGIAVDYEKTLTASSSNYVTLTKDIDYKVVDTGDYIEAKYNAVIMVEDLIKISDNSVQITEPIRFFENIRSTGEDIVKTQMVLPSFHKIRAVDVGSIIASGNEKVFVYKPFKVGIMPTGTEIVDVSKGDFSVGEIIDSNSYMLKALAMEMGFSASVLGIIDDDYESLKQNIINLTKNNDIVLINAGSSAGREDFTKDVLKEIGEVIVHGICIKPGKPAVLSIVNNKMVIGIPGYPVACYVVFEKLIKKIINKLLKINQLEENINTILTKRITSSLKHMEFVRVKIGFVNGKWVCTPLSRGAGVSMSLVDCDGILEIPKEYEGFNSGEEVNVKLTKPLEEIKNKIVCIGSHDLILDFVRDTMIKNSNINLSSTHVGSLNGVLTLKNKECFIAPMHILDEKTGEYNISTIKDIFKGEKMALIKGVKRKQGLIVQKGNPLNIKSISDLKKVKYVNRQRGSGTYILLDYLIKKDGINKKDIVGFDFSVPTHFDVAINVKEGVADCGLGILSVAKALDLDFIEVFDEEYDFLIYQKDLETKKAKTFIKTLQSTEVKEQLENAGGYGICNIGEVIIFEG